VLDSSVLFQDSVPHHPIVGPVLLAFVVLVSALPFAALLVGVTKGVSLRDLPIRSLEVSTTRAFLSFSFFSHWACRA
jgi:hypothetical protein